MNDHPNRKTIRLKGYDYSRPGCYFITICTQNRRHYFGEIVGATLCGRQNDPCGRPNDPCGRPNDPCGRPNDPCGRPNDPCGRPNDPCGRPNDPCGRPNDPCGHPNDPHMMIQYWLLEMEKRFRDVFIDHYVIMPNHVHFIMRKIPIQDARGFDGANFDGHMAVDTNEHTTIDGGTGDRGMGGHETGDGGTGDRGMRGDINGDGGTGDHIGSPLRDIIAWFKTMTTNEYIRGVRQGLYVPFDKRLWQRNYYEHIIRDGKEYAAIAQYIENNPQNWSRDTLYSGAEKP